MKFKLAKLFLALLSLVIMVPLLYVVYISFQTPEEYYKMLWPRALQFDNYRNILCAPYFWRWAVNSGVIALGTLVMVLIIGAMAGYVVAKFSSRPVRVVAVLILGALMIPVHMVLMPVFILSRHLGIINTPWSVMGPGVAFGIPIAMYIFRGFFMNIPDSLAEAARIDGAGELGVFLKVMLPMTKPAMATVGIFTFLGAWNGFLFPLTLLQSTETYTLPVGLATIGTQYFTNYPAQAAAMLLVSLPLILFYARFNRLVIQGMVEGAVKG
ncbi:multiple sugar transport system permease protein/raffinose/stachyose/melibiose transport system permease protein [Hydrogenispora ethanolica]|uniref:Multiple sugar transport system permease protein/raffinose/stachyose/melibiose transport system permease protein n=1 Tax=Hydrogenispora ethanolica TaxID=1082276 RepID=A0A4R1SD88_HYDET|nr:carbohydrate ABC transporter permease [Hydrogenispora ethanolica]TCL77000.1 multiple sugar transport system permease protein/raffinose/stachyose/melibiose transport system permease protein [Hydrogenispora ethanolica]